MYKQKGRTCLLLVAVFLFIDFFLEFCSLPTAIGRNIFLAFTGLCLQSREIFGATPH